MFYDVIESPHKYLPFLLSHVNASQAAAQASWSYLNDALRLPLLLTYPSATVACGALAAAAAARGEALPARWWHSSDDSNRNNNNNNNRNRNHLRPNDNSKNNSANIEDEVALEDVLAVAEEVLSLYQSPLVSPFNPIYYSIIYNFTYNIAPWIYAYILLYYYIVCIWFHRRLGWSLCLRRAESCSRWPIIPTPPSL